MPRHLTSAALLAALLALAPAAGDEASPEPPGGRFVEIKTNMGTIKVELFAKKAPKTVKNFLKYVEARHYDGLIFHRVIENFMIQGGGMLPGLKEKKTRGPIECEADNMLKNERGTIAMARTSAPHSATAQFFINVQDNPALDHRDKTDRGWGYCVFGKVVAGMDVVDKIRAVKTGSAGVHNDVPVKDVVIESMRAR